MTNFMPKDAQSIMKTIDDAFVKIDKILSSHKTEAFNDNFVKYVWILRRVRS